MTKTKNIWTDKDNERLLELIEAGVSPARTSVIFKRSISGVQHQARRLGMPFPTMRARKQERDAKIEAALVADDV